MEILKRKSVFITLTAFLIFVLASYFVGVYFKNDETRQIRTITLEESQIDYQTVLDSFDDAELNVRETFVDFVGSKKIDASIFEEIDYLSVDEKDNLQQNNNVEYHFTYDVDKNVVTISAAITLPDGEVMMDTIEGVGFYNEKGEIDAIMNIDGEGVLLSEMRNSGLIANAGLFSFFKKIATAIAVVAAAVAVVAVVVATAGAAAPALVAAGVGIVSASTGVAATIASVSLTVAAIAAGVAITANVAELVWEGVKHELKEYAEVASKFVKGLVFLAVATSDGRMLVSPIPVSVATGAAFMNQRGSVYSIDPIQAYNVATAAGGGIAAIHENAEKKGYFNHYHTWNRVPEKSHAFYGVPRTW